MCAVVLSKCGSYALALGTSLSTGTVTIDGSELLSTPATCSCGGNNLPCSKNRSS